MSRWLSVVMVDSFTSELMLFLFYRCYFMLQVLVYVTLCYCFGCLCLSHNTIEMFFLLNFLSKVYQHRNNSMLINFLSLHFCLS